jgi:hypothetical protein
MSAGSQRLISYKKACQDGNRILTHGSEGTWILGVGQSQQSKSSLQTEGEHHVWPGEI